MKNALLFIAFCGIIALALIPNACKHEPLTPPGDNNPVPVDTTKHDTIPPLPVDSTDYSGTPCSPDTVYFQNQILPLLVSQCAKSGCHDNISHKENVITTDYTSIMKKIKPFYPTQSKLYTSIITSSSDDRMPPPPAAKWTQDQINLLKKWIEQGAKNNVCNEGYGGCDTTGVTYANFIQPVLANKCLGCHATASSGGGILLNNYAQVKASVQTGKFYGSVAWSAGYSQMPKSSQQLSSCYVNKVQAWIKAGMPQ